MFLIYVPVASPRCEYIFELIFKELGIAFKTSTDIKAFQAHQEEKINYSSKRSNDEFYLRAYPFLFEPDIKEIEVPVENKLGTTVLFSNNEGCNLGFDIFSAVFYMISRYEEYLPFTPDKYGRFKSCDSLAYRHNFLHQPVVDTWINIFKNALLNKFPHLQIRPSAFQFILTYDIDIAYAFKGRSIFRLIGSSVKDAAQLQFSTVFNRILSLSHMRKDPWDVYDLLLKTIAEKKLPSIFFFLLADYSRHDKNISYRHPLMKELVKRITGITETGIHPSFKTSVFPEKNLIEKKRLETLCGKIISKSRQHYLRFTLPGTYNKLIEAGIKEDYSMGFADMPGFRAGTCKPFYFYDITKEQSTGLKIFPVTVMEGSFIDYLQIRPAEALTYIFALIDEIKKVNGTFISIWHNHTLSDTGRYKGWKYVHDVMIERLLLKA